LIDDIEEIAALLAVLDGNETEARRLMLELTPASLLEYGNAVKDLLRIVDDVHYEKVSRGLE